MIKCQRKTHGLPGWYTGNFTALIDNLNLSLITKPSVGQGFLYFLKIIWRRQCCLPSAPVTYRLLSGPFVPAAIPALQPVVHDLFVLRGTNKADAGKELETQKEVVVSMLLRLIQYHQVRGGVGRSLTLPCPCRDRRKCHVAAVCCQCASPGLSGGETQGDIRLGGVCL